MKKQINFRLSSFFWKKGFASLPQNQKGLCYFTLCFGVSKCFRKPVLFTLQQLFKVEKRMQTIAFRFQYKVLIKVRGFFEGDNVLFFNVLFFFFFQNRQLMIINQHHFFITEFSKGKPKPLSSLRDTQCRQKKGRKHNSFYYKVAEGP